MMARAYRPRGSGIAALDGFAESLRLLLVDEEYTLEDVSMMFGVTREWVRQLAHKYAIPTAPHNKGLRCVRLWQDHEHRFRPVRRVFVAGADRLDRRAEAKRVRIAKYAGRRAEAVAALQDLARILERTPTCAELARALGVSNANGYLNAYLGVHQRSLAGVWTDAGLTIRRKGSVGHVRGPSRPGARRTHCRRNHPMTPENTRTYLRASGGEVHVCRTCRKRTGR